MNRGIGFTILRTTITTSWSASTSDRKSTRLNSSHSQISYAVFCLKKKNRHQPEPMGLLRPGPRGAAAAEARGGAGLQALLRHGAGRLRAIARRRVGDAARAVDRLQ